MELGKVPPHDIEAEQAVLGSMLTDKDAVISAIEVLKEEDFYRTDNRAIYEAILNLYNRAEPIDIITVKAELESMGKFEQVGGLTYLVSLPDKVPTTANAMKYIKIVEEKSTLRSLIKTANEIIELGYDPTEDVEDIMESAEKKIFNIMQNKDKKGYAPIQDILVESFNQLEELYNRKQHITGVPSGFIELDYKTAGFHGSDLVLIAARPAMGKSAFALNIATNAAVRANVPVVIFSLEMSKEQMVNRILCSEAMVDSNKVRTGKLEEDDWTKLAGSIGPLSDSEIYIDDTPGISVSEIRAMTLSDVKAYTKAKKYHRLLPKAQENEAFWLGTTTVVNSCKSIYYWSNNRGACVWKLTDERNKPTTPKKLPFLMVAFVEKKYLAKI